MTRGELFIDALGKAERNVRLLRSFDSGLVRFRIEYQAEDGAGYDATELIDNPVTAYQELAREKLKSVAWTFYCVSTRNPEMNVDWEACIRPILDKPIYAWTYEERALKLFREMYELKDPINWNYPVGGAL